MWIIIITVMTTIIIVMTIRAEVGQVDAGRHFAHAGRAEHSKRQRVSNNADENEERRDEGVDILTTVQELHVGLHASLATSQPVTRHKFPVARSVEPGIRGGCVFAQQLRDV